MALADRLSRPTQLAWAALAIGIVAGAICLFGGIGQARELERAYLTAVTYFLGLSLGALSWLLVQHLVRGAWGELSRRIWEAAASTLPLFLLLLVPIFFDLSTIYPWANPAVIEAMEPRFASKVAAKATYFAPWFFWLRALLVFAVFITMAGLLVYWSRLHDRQGEPHLIRRMKIVAGPGLFIYALALTFGATDWWKSLEPAWYSTMYPVLHMVGFAVGALALAVLMIVILGRPGRPLAPWLTPRLYGHLGSLLLALVLLWIYVNFSQYLITWSGDLPDKVQWLLPRARTSWQWVAAALVLLHFAVPFLILLPGANRRNPRLLAGVAVWLLVLRTVDLHWLLAPSFRPSGAFVHWLDFATLFAVGGVWTAVFIWILSSRPLVPRARDVLEEARP